MVQSSGLKNVFNRFKRGESAAKTPGNKVGDPNKQDAFAGHSPAKRLFAFSPAKASSSSRKGNKEHGLASKDLIPAAHIGMAVDSSTDAAGDDSNIRVVVRVRPRNDREASMGGAICVQPQDGKSLRLVAPAEPHSFAFDHVTNETSSQEDMFNVAGRPIVDNCLRGFNSCLFAYGQTGSGKTYSMLGGEQMARDAAVAGDERRKPFGLEAESSVMKLSLPRSPLGIPFVGGDLRSHLSLSLPISFVPPIQQARRYQRHLAIFSGNGGSARVPKDPKAYADIEELRRELEDGKGQAPFTLTRTIKWLSDASTNGGGGLAFQAYRWVLGLDTPPSFKSYRRPAEIEATALLQIEETTDPELIEAIQTLLIIPKTAAVRLIYRCPAAGNMSSTDLMMRIVDLKGLFPGTNVAQMVELLPTAFLSEQNDQWKKTLEKLRRTSELLREGLQGADVDSIFEADPTILFESPESIELGLKRMKELWKVDTIALKNSEPEELALAVRALSFQGPPKSV